MARVTDITVPMEEASADSEADHSEDSAAGLSEDSEAGLSEEEEQAAAGRPSPEIRDDIAVIKS